MTPFGQKLRKMRKTRSISQKQMANAIGVAASYLSQLERGHKGSPSWALVQDIISYLNIIWDEAEDLQKLARLSHPRVAVDTSGLSTKATEAANLLAQN